VHGFIVPRLDGPISGGTLYNRMLLAALMELGQPCEVLLADQAARKLAKSVVEDAFWVDSLYLDHLPEWAAATRPGTGLGLIVHYLPTLVSLGEEIGPADVTASEMAALQVATRFLVPSPWMRELLKRLVGSSRPILVVEPGRPAAVALRVPEPPVRAVMVANLVEGKGVELFLSALAEQVHDTDELRIDIVGGDNHAPAYAERCRSLANQPRLRHRVQFLGERTHAQTLEVIAESNPLVSCSRMESYGMALMEARVLGIPILATRGGNVAAMVEPESGGELFTGTADLVARLLRLTRDHVEFGRRMSLARKHAWEPRPWSEAAREYVSQMKGAVHVG